MWTLDLALPSALFLSSTLSSVTCLNHTRDGVVHGRVELKGRWTTHETGLLSATPTAFKLRSTGYSRDTM